MKIKNILIICLGILSFFGVIWWGKNAMSLSLFPDSEVSLKQLIVDNSVSDWEAQAEKFYTEGRFGDAIALLEKLNNNYVAQGNELGQARVARNLALVYQQTGEWSKAQSAITQSLNLLDKQANSKERQLLLAQALEVQGLLQLAIGQPEKALDTWQKATINYQEIGDFTGVTRNQINQSQALERLGLYRQTIKVLDRLNATLQQQPDSLVKVKCLQSLGDALRVVGDLDRSQKILEQGLAIAENLKAADAIASMLLSLGETARLAQELPTALDYYQKAVQTTTSPYIKTQAMLNYLNVLVNQKEGEKALELLPQIQASLTQLPLSRQAINARINLARKLMQLRKEASNQLSLPSNAEVGKMLATAVQQAETLQDQRTLSYAVGNFGRLYEENQQWDFAQQLTKKALLLSQSINATDINFRWQWQLGRIYKQQGNRQEAIAAYNQAVNSLQSIRSDLVAISAEAQFDFRDTIEPVYRELVDLLLPVGQVVEQSDLQRARTLIDSLQLAELDNFFRDACLKTQAVKIDQIDPKAAVISTIILSNTNTSSINERIEVIAALPGKPLRRYTTVLPSKEIEATITRANDALTIPRLRLSQKNYFIEAKKFYDWLIHPIENDLANSGIQTLVFVLDGSLRNISLAGIYDGQKYLVQKYSVAIAPGLQLVDAKPLQYHDMRVLTAGLSEARQGFAPLPNVSTELNDIAKEIHTEKLLNQSFTASNFKTKVQSDKFPIIHLATHGKFSSKAADTFILTWDKKINAKDLDTLLRSNQSVTNPIELLVFSACQTAAGDNRATLGLTGIAVRAGARSTLATLWSVDDEATALFMSHFYKELNNNKVTKAEALRRTQQLFLQDSQFSHPYFWSAFVLVGNWL
ncbi:CHAT domain-containing protein [Phormidium sp. LEGE 05292]|uniref:CHAT domain-containing protein n=1 Tax=[Phormidium] sp. LEGE 05292 TaxID=767427 RepID=UPI00188265F9|nr:CHAT domain-containing protein [Phormidium sp. LEGE 05292]MBE9224930.1 CHAT domain-containing protein [Phormidium sp. LEGE 05292]